MPKESVAVSYGQPPAAITTANPLETYRDYCKAVRRRDLDALVKFVAEDVRVILFELFTNSDGGPLFDLWCESQQLATVVTGCSIQGDSAIVHIRSWRSQGQIMMMQREGSWYIVSEKHWPVADARPA